MIGIDGNCHFANGVGFFGTAAVSALVGNLSASTKYTSSSPTFSASSGVPVNYQSISPKDSTQGVPGIEGKFGVDYTHRAGANSTFTASLGYQYVTYFNAIATYNPAVVFGNVNTGSIALSSLAKTWSNYTVQGPFLNLGFSFA